MNIVTKEPADVISPALMKRIKAVLAKELAPASVEMVNVEDDVDHTGELSIAIRVLLRDSERGMIDQIPAGAFLRALTNINDLIFESGDKRVVHLFYVDGAELLNSAVK
jgi:hypothetical protein